MPASRRASLMKPAERKFAQFHKLEIACGAGPQLFQLGCAGDGGCAVLDDHLTVGGHDFGAVNLHGVTRMHDGPVVEFHMRREFFEAVRNGDRAWHVFFGSCDQSHCVCPFDWFSRSAWRKLRHCLGRIRSIRSSSRWYRRKWQHARWHGAQGARAHQAARFAPCARGSQTSR